MRLSPVRADASYAPFKRRHFVWMQAGVLRLPVKSISLWLAAVAIEGGEVAAVRPSNGKNVGAWVGGGTISNAVAEQEKRVSPRSCKPDFSLVAELALGAWYFIFQPDVTDAVSTIC